MAPKGLLFSISINEIILIERNCCELKENLLIYYGGLPFGLVALATESSHRLIMGRWFNCIFLHNQ